MSARTGEPDDVAELKQKLESTQQQNLKLKAKLKQTLSKASSTTTPTTHIDAECQTEHNLDLNEVANTSLTCVVQASSSQVASNDGRSSPPVNLEAQLRYCHEECEKVVVKLRQLKTQNESLNNKIKSIKSSMVVI